MDRFMSQIYAQEADRQSERIRNRSKAQGEGFMGYWHVCPWFKALAELPLLDHQTKYTRPASSTYHTDLEIHRQLNFKKCMR